MVSRSDSNGAGRSEWLLRLSHCPASSAVPRTSAHEKNVRCRLGIHWATGESRRNIQADPRLQKACARFCGDPAAAGVQSMFDALYPPGLQWYWRADFLNEISDDAISQHIRFGEALPTMHSTMHMYPIDGAASRVGKNDTA